MRRKLPKLLGLFALTLLLLPLLLFLLLYIPAVPPRIATLAQHYMARHTAWQFSVEEVQLHFPLHLHIARFKLYSKADTLLSLEQLEINILPLPLLRGDVDITPLQLYGATIHYHDSLTQMQLEGEVDTLQLQALPLNPFTQQLNLPQLRLHGATLNLALGEPSEPDTLPTQLPAWNITAQELSLQRIRVQINQSDFALACFLPQAELDSSSVTLADIAVQAQQLRLHNANCTLTFDDTTHFAFTQIELLADTIYNQSLTTRTHVKLLSLRESSGLELTHLSATFAMDTLQTTLQNLHLTTPHSHLTAEGEAATTLLLGEPDGTFQLQTAGAIGWDDLCTFFPQLPPQRPLLILQTQLRGTATQIELDTLQLEQPRHLLLGVGGEFSLPNLEGNANITAEITDINYLKPLLLNTHIASEIDLTKSDFTAHLSQQRGKATLHLTLTREEGELHLAATYHPLKEQYQLELTTHQLPLGRYLVKQPWGNLSASLTLEGEHFDPLTPTFQAKLQTEVESFTYNQIPYRDLALVAEQSAGNIHAELRSEALPLAFHLLLQGTITPQQATASLQLDASQFDLGAMGWVSDTLQLAGVMNLWGEYRAEATPLYDLTMHLNRFTINEQPLPPLSLSAHSESEGTEVALREGDMTFRFDSPQPLASLTRGIEESIAQYTQQWEARNITPQPLPPLQIALQAGKQNSLYRVTQQEWGVTFDSLQLVAQSDTLRPFHLSASLLQWHTPVGGGDSLIFNLHSDSLGILSADLAGLQVASLLDTTHLAKPMKGELGATFQMGIAHQTPWLNGEITLPQLTYGSDTLGRWNTSLHYQSDTLGRHDVALAVAQANRTLLQLSGSYADTLALRMQLTRLPLTIANLFLPAELVQLSGRASAEFALRGSLTQPLLSGALCFDTTKITIPLVEGVLHLSDDTLHVENNCLSFSNYPIRAANANPLFLRGTVDGSTNWSNPLFDMKMQARDIQLLNAPRNKQTLLYGKVNMDLDLALQGTLNQLRLQGNVGLLNGTDVIYQFKESPLALKRETNTMVSFVSLADTTLQTPTDTLPTVRLGGVTTVLNLAISEAVKAGVTLSPNGQDRVDLRGGGNLTFSANALGTTQLSGRYQLSGGTVIYNPPILASKRFNISPESYVEWTGNMDDPLLHLIATETVRTTVSSEGSNDKVVEFHVIISIKNNLDNLAITFDLAAPTDLEMEDELASLTPEQRASQAMNLLLYNSYTGAGSSGKGITNPLNAFLQKELNEWAHDNLKGVDVSFGIDTQNGAFLGGENSGTNYSYQLSKSLFNDRVRIVVGGGYSTDNDATENLRDNLIDDLSIEYMLNQRDNMFIRVFRQNNYESILEGEVMQTGVGFVVRKKLARLSHLFRSERNTTPRPHE